MANYDASTLNFSLSTPAQLWRPARPASRVRRAVPSAAYLVCAKAIRNVSKCQSGMRSAKYVEFIE